MTDAAISKIKNKRIFMTGGTGFFGKSLMFQSSAFLENDVVVLAPDADVFVKKHSSLLKGKRIDFLKGDVRDFTFPESTFDYIFHAAATSGIIIPEEEMRSVVIEGTKRVLEFALRQQHLINFLFVSSGAVYGDNYQIPLYEELPCKPLTFYGKMKKDAEQLCLDSRVPCSIARCFAFVGEYLPLDTHFAIGNFINDCLHERKIVIKGNGSPIRTYLYSGDLAHWLWTILLHGKPGRIYNVGSDQEISIRTLAERVRKIAGANAGIEILSPPIEAPPERYVPDVSLARRELGLKPRISLEEAVRRTIEYHKRRMD